MERMMVLNFSCASGAWTSKYSLFPMKRTSMIEQTNSSTCRTSFSY